MAPVKAWSTKEEVLKDIRRASGRIGKNEGIESCLVVGDVPPPVLEEDADEQIQMMFGHGVERNAIQTEQQAPDLIGLRKIIRMVNSNNSNTDTSYIGEDAGDASDYFYAITKQSSLNPEVEAFIPKANSSSNCHKEPENKNNIEEYATNLKLKISDAAKSNSYDLKREKNVAIATLLKLYANNDTPVKLCTPEYFENKLEKPSTSNSSYCNSSTPSMLPQDTEMKKSIEKVNNWLEPTKRKTQAVSLEPIFFKRKTVQTVKSPANSENSKLSQNERKYKPSQHATELAKKYEQNNKKFQTETQAVTWANLQEKLREKDSLIKSRSEGKNLESNSSIQ